ncbi:glycosyltransferase family 4 protein [Pseudomonas sp. S1_E04]
MQTHPPSLRRLVIWEPSLSPHKADLFTALARLNPEIEVICCADKELSESRRAIGWSVPDPVGYRNIVAPDLQTIEGLVTESISTSLHIFSGIRWVPTILKGLTAVKANKARYAIMSEPRVASGWSGALRWLQSWGEERYHRRHAAFILAIGRNGPPWYTSTGYSAKKVIPFAYFISPPAMKPYVPPPDKKLRLGYLGRLVKTKGVFDVVDALAQMNGCATLDIAGAGPDEEALKARCISSGVEAVFRGVLPMNEINSFFREIDVLILASSAKDGWGVVVSEALLCGVPVVATTTVGASIVLERSLFGRCIPPKNPTAIANAVEQMRNTGELSPAKRAPRAAAAANILSASAGAEYLMRVISWYDGRDARPQDFYQLHNDCR